MKDRGLPPPPSVLPDISPTRGEIGCHFLISPITNVAEGSLSPLTANLPPCGGDVRQDRGGCRRAPTASLAALMLGIATSAQAACPIELSVFEDRDGVASVEFVPTGESAAVTNTFRMVLGDGVMLNGIVMWSADVPRPNGMLMNNCPEGDLTGDEIAACTVWEGVIYTADASGIAGLLPAEGAGAPQALVFPDLGRALKQSSVFGERGFTRLPFDVFALKGCQE